MSNQVSFPFKAACVTMLVLQNSALALTMRYSRAVLKEKYLTSTTIVLNEVVKLIVAICMVLIGFRISRPVKLQHLPKHLISIIFCREGMLMLVPGLLYFLMNQLAFIGLENLDASTYSLVSQLKILTTAFFARVLLHKQLHWFQWRALTLLVIGVILVQQQPPKPVVIPQAQLAITSLPTGQLLAPVNDFNLTLPTRRVLGVNPITNAFKAPARLNVNNEVTRYDASSPSANSGVVAANKLAAAAGEPKSMWAQWKGFIAAAFAAVLSGLAGCYMEKMMKGGSLTVWDRNIQLAVYGIILGVGQIILFSSDADREYAAENGWLGGYSFVAGIVVLLNSLGGILVSLVLAYLDNIIRGFATSIAIFITAFVSYTVFHDVELTIIFGCGVLTVLLSVFNYNDTMMSPPAPSQLSHPATSPSPSPLAQSSPSPAAARLLAAIGTPPNIELNTITTYLHPGDTIVKTGTMPRSRSQNLTPRVEDDDSEEKSLLSR